MEISHIACLLSYCYLYIFDYGVDSTLFKDIGYLISAAICLGTLKIYKSNHIHEKHDKPTTVSTLNFGDILFSLVFLMNFPGHFVIVDVSYCCG